MTATLDQLVRLARADQQLTRRLADSSAAAVGALFDRHVVDLSDASLARFVESSTPLVEQMQLAAARQKAAYVAGYVSAATDELVVAPTLAPEQYTSAALRGVPTGEVYARPIITARSAAAAGHNLAESLSIGRDRAVSTARTDPVLSANRAFQDVAAQLPRIVGYRRVPGFDACQFCLAASTQRYFVEQLQPLHNRCTCSQAPIVGTSDPGQIIDRDLHRQLQESEALAELSLTSAVRRSKTDMSRNADRAAAARRDASTETNPARRARFEQQADTWSTREAEAAAKLAEREGRLRTHRDEYGTTRAIRIEQHGELGPVIVRSQDSFTAR